MISGRRKMAKFFSKNKYLNLFKNGKNEPDCIARRSKVKNKLSVIEIPRFINGNLKANKTELAIFKL